MRINVQVSGTEDVQTLFSKLKKNIEENVPAPSVLSFLETTFRFENFARTGALTEKWKPLTARTYKEKIALGYGGRGTLIRTGNLQNNVHKFFDKKKVEFGFNADYAKQHQEGDPEKKLPARILLKDSQYVVDNVVIKVTEELFKNL